MSDTIELPKLRRRVDVLDLRIERKKDNAPSRISFSASSDIALRRFFGTETLDHSDDAVDLSVVRKGAAPLLFNHDWDDPIGMVKTARLVDGRMQMEADFFDTARAREVQKMVEGGLRNISIGYEITDLAETDEGFVATRWQPYESSIVSVPADPDVGIGRSRDEVCKPVRVKRALSQSADTATRSGGANMPEENTAPASTADDQNMQLPAGRIEITRQGDDGDQFDPLAAERQRKKLIRQFAKINNVSPEIEDHWIRSGATLDQVGDQILKIHEERGKQDDAPAMLGMSKTEVRQYSLMKAIRAAQSNNWQKAGLELEAHKAMMSRDNLQQKESGSFFVPMDVQARQPTYGRRDFNVAGAGSLVGTDHLAGSFIELLRNKSVLMGSGATRLTGLRGNVSIPKMTSGATAHWLATETTPTPESQPAIGQLQLTPRNVAALTEISHQMLQQGDPSAEQLVLNDLAQTVALAADLGGLAGDGAGGAPTGVLNTVGVGDFDGLALDYEAVLDAQVDVVKANAMIGSMAYINDPDTTVKMMTRVKFAGTDSPIWAGNILEGDCAGFPGRTSNQVPADTSIFGAWAAMILAEWGVLELAVNPNQNFAAGITGLRAWYTMDVGIRYPQAFSKAEGVT